MVSWSTPSNRREGRFSTYKLRAHPTRALDPVSRQIVPLFNPRVDRWDDHFRWSADWLVIHGRTPAGRATVRLLRMNRRGAARLRAGFIHLGVHPPPS